MSTYAEGKGSVVSGLALVQLKVSVNDSWLDNRVLRCGSHTDYRHGAGSVRAPGSCRVEYKSLGININLWWGLFMVFFGCVLLASYASPRRRAARNAARRRH